MPSKARRNVVRSIAIGLLAISGCSTQKESTENIDIHNNTEKTVSVTVELTNRESEKVVLSEEIQIGPDEYKRYDISDEGAFQIVIVTGDRRGDYKWNPGNIDLLQVQITEDDVQFAEAVE